MPRVHLKRCSQALHFTAYSCYGEIIASKKGYKTFKHEKDLKLLRVYNYKLHMDFKS